MTRSGRLTAEQSVIVGQNVRTLRCRAGWTLARLAGLFGRSVSGVCRMELGERGFTGSEVEQLAAIFGVTAADLLPPGCLNCDGQPPRGFTCDACGAIGSRPATAGRAEPPLFRGVSTEYLTPREMEVLTLLCRDGGDERVFRAPAAVWEIAGGLDMSEGEVKQVLLGIYRKLGIPEGPDRRLRLANVAIEFGYLMTPAVQGSVPAARP